MAAARLHREHPVHGPASMGRGSSKMIRLWTNLRPWFQRGRAWPAHGSGQIPIETCDDELPVTPEKPWGCGWFDSSLDLRQGLAAIEHQGVPIDLAVQMMLAPQAGRA
jgi:hypothetical protein